MPHEILTTLNERYESGLILQDTNLAATTPFYQPFAETFATTDLPAMIPVHKGVTVHAGVKNLLDRNYYYRAGYPQEGRHWSFNLRYQY